jgi:hypothetical protein
MTPETTSPFPTHPHITCPFCRANWGGFKAVGDKIIHLDIVFSADAGMQTDCRQADLREHVESIDDNGNLVFKPVSKVVFDELAEAFKNKPTEYHKGTVNWRDFTLLFHECANWGNIDGDDGDFDWEQINTDSVRALYDEGKNLDEILRSFLVPCV